MLSLFPLLSKRLDELTNADLSEVANVLKIKVVVTDELKAACLSLLKGMKFETVADLVQKPESLKQLISFVTPPPPQLSAVEASAVMRCPHCSQFFIL